MTIPECYKILGIEVTYDEKVIKTAYRKRATELHPDKNPHPAAHEGFIMLQEAYETVLLYLEFREKYGTTLGQMLVHEEEQREHDIQERVKEARRKQQAKRDREQALIASVFMKYTRTWRVYLVALLAVLSIPVVFMIVCDFTTEGDIESNAVLRKRTTATDATPEKMMFADYYITIHGEEIPVPPEFFIVCQVGEPVYIERGHFLRQVTCLHTSYLRRDFDAQPLYFFNDAWVFLCILLLIPLLSFLFVKANFLFVFFFVHFNLYLYPLVLMYVLLGNARLFRFWEHWISG